MRVCACVCACVCVCVCVCVCAYTGIYYLVLAVRLHFGDEGTVVPPAFVFHINAFTFLTCVCACARCVSGV